MRPTVVTVGGLPSFAEQSIWPHLRAIGFHPARHVPVPYDKGTEAHFQSSELVIVLSDMLGHAQAQHARSAAQRAGAPYVVGQRKWPGLLKTLEQHGHVVDGRAVGFEEVDAPSSPLPAPTSQEPALDALLALSSRELVAYLARRPWTRTPTPSDRALRGRLQDRFYRARAAAGIVVSGATPLRVDYPTWVTAMRRAKLSISPLPDLAAHGLVWVNRPEEAPAAVSTAPEGELDRRPAEEPEAIPEAPPLDPARGHGPPDSGWATVGATPPSRTSFPAPVDLRAVVGLLVEAARSAGLHGQITLDLSTGRMIGRRRRIIEIEEDVEVQ